MSSKLNRIAQLHKEFKKNPITRQYALIVSNCPQPKICLISETEWSFIHDGIMNRALYNILLKKDIHLDLIYSQEECLAMNCDQRANIISLSMFDNIKDFDKYCQLENIEIVHTYQT